MPRRRWTPHQKPKKGTKKVSYELIDAASVFGETIYRMARELVAESHEHLKDARIAIAWCTSWKADADGRVTLGKLKKASDLDRELAAFDFIVLLNRVFWMDLQVTHAQRLALLDHELCHAGVAYNTRTGEPMLDERGRPVYRTVKHDLEEFSAVVRRHGIWRLDIERFAAELNRAARGPWVPCGDCQRSQHPGWVDDGDGRLARCVCWSTHQQRYAEAVAS